MSTTRIVPIETTAEQQDASRIYAYEHGTDKPGVAGWKWPY